MLFYFLLFGFLPVYGQETRIKHEVFFHYPPEKGLSHRSVNQILKDHQGYMWFATPNGLNRFDGYNFTVYQHIPGDTTSISENNISCLYEDRQGRLWAGTRTRGLNLYDRKTDSFIRVQDTNSPLALASYNNIVDIYQDGSGKLWIGTYKGVALLDPATREFEYIRHDPSDPYSIGKNGVTDIFADKKGTIWIATWESGLNKYLGKDKRFKTYHSSNTKGFNEYIFSISEGKNNKLWIGTISEGIIIFDTETEKAKSFRPDFFSGFIIRDIKPDKQGNMWVATQNKGLNRIDSMGNIDSFVPSQLDKNSISDDVLFSLYRDNAGSMWIGTANYGIDVWHKKLNFNSYIPVQPYQKPGSNIVRAIFPVGDSIFWIRTESAGILKYNLKTQQWNRYLTSNDLRQYIILPRIDAVFKDMHDHIFVINQKQLFRYQPSTDKFVPENFFHRNKKMNNLNYRFIHFDKTGRRWLFQKDSVFCYYPEKDTLVNFHSFFAKQNKIPLSNLSGMMQDSKQRLWFYSNKGILFFNEKKFQIKIFQHQKGDKYSLSDNQVLHVYEDNRERIWVATRKGLNLFDEKKNRFKHFSFHKQLENGIFYRITSDKNNNIWLASDKGLSLFEPGKKNYRQFSIKSYRPFHANSLNHTRSGNIVFGGENSFVIVNPDDIIKNQSAPDVSLTNFYLFNEKWKPGDELLPQPVNNLTSIKLSSSESVFSFEFSALNYILPNENMYAYMLKGYDKNWIYTSADNRLITYRNLPGGDYTLKIKAANNDRVWSQTPKTLKVKILPPWWKTLWFQITAIAVLISAGILFYLLKMMRVRRQNILLEKQVKKRTHEIEAKNEELATQTDQLQEVNLALKKSMNEIELRTRELQKQSEELFQTNMSLRKANATRDRLFSIIAHDLKNPFQSVQNLTKKLNKDFQRLPDKQKQRYIGLIQDSSTRAFSLLENLLDWARSQMDMIQNMPHDIELNKIIEKTIQLLNLSVEKKEIVIEKHLPENFTAFADENMLTTVIRNITNNALKYTPKGGKITFLGDYKSNNFARIVIKDSGIGMHSEMVDNLFNIQTKQVSEGTDGEQGTGLGLLICKEFMEKNAGKINVRSIPGQGSEFELLIPANKFQYETQEREKQSQEIKHQEKELSKESSKKVVYPESIFKTRILIAEDNPNIRLSLKEYLNEFAEIIEAADGKIALETAFQHQPGLIISDIVMPGMDGFELCSRIKSNEQTSHIPVILLTARTAEKSRRQGFETGADAYITKPFDPELLVLRIKNILLTRSKYIKRYTESPELSTKAIAANPIDEDFLKKAQEVVVNNLTNADFDSNKFVKEMGMSRTRLFMKLKELTDQSATEFIRTIRLKKAAQLLKEQDINVTETAYAVGFSNRVYFSKTFTRHFGISPKDYISKVRRN